MKMQLKTILFCIPLITLLSACSQQTTGTTSFPESAEDAEVMLNTATVGSIVLETATEIVPSPTSTGYQSARLTLDASAEEIREKLLTSSLNWRTMEVEAEESEYALNPDNSVDYVIIQQSHSWIDQPSLRFRTEEVQLGTENLPMLAISDGILSVSRGGTTVISGYPIVPGITYVNAVPDLPTEAKGIALLRAGETIFPPMGEVYNGALNSELFSSAYPVQYPGFYQAEALETIAGRETLNATYDDMDRWGRDAIQFTVWIDTETGVVLKISKESSEFHFKTELQVTSIHYNLALDDALFNPEEALPDLALPAMQSETIGDITIYAGEQQFIEDKMSVKLCFELPSTADWMIQELLVNGISAYGLEGRLIYLENAGSRQVKGLHCERIKFTFPADETTLHLQINSLFAPPREGSLCDNTNIVQKMLEEEGSGIRFTCEEDHMKVITIMEKPAEMDEESARMKIDDLYSQLNFDEPLNGPWVFDFPVTD